MEIKNDNYLFKRYDLDLIKDAMQSGDVENTLQWCLLYVENAVKGLFADNYANAQEPTVFTTLFYLLRKAWENLGLSWLPFLSGIEVNLGVCGVSDV